MCRAAKRTVDQFDDHRQQEAEDRPEQCATGDQQGAIGPVRLVGQVGRLDQRQSRGPLFIGHARTVLRLEQGIRHRFQLIAERHGAAFKLRRLLEDGRCPSLAHHRCIGRRESAILGRAKRGNGRIIIADLSGNRRRTPRIAAVGGGATKCVEPGARGNHVRMPVAILAQSSCQRGFGRSQLRVALGRTIGFAKKLAILALERDDLRAIAAGIEEPARIGAGQCGTVARLELGDLALDRLHLHLQLARLILEEAYRERRLIFLVIAVDPQEAGDIALHDVASLAGIGIIEAHVERDHVAGSARPDIAGQGSDRRRLAHLVDDRRHRLALAFAGVQVVLLDQRDQIAATEHLLADLGDPFANRAAIRILCHILRQILRFNEKRCGRSIHRRQGKCRHRRCNQADEEGDDHVPPPLPQDPGQVIEHPAEAGALRTVLFVGHLMSPSRYRR